MGHEKGAFTGATTAREGSLSKRTAEPCYLTRFREMAIELQAKLPRVLQEQEVERLGGKNYTLDVRILATTNRNLTQEVAQSRFREDLYFRLNVFPIELPPLRDRSSDIVPLANRFIERYAAGRPLTLSSEAERRLLAHGWRGNIRELGNCIHRACILAPATR